MLIYRYILCIVLKFLFDFRQFYCEVIFVEAMKKIMEAERQASSLVTEARVYKTMLLNQARRKGEDKAKSLLLDAENIRKKHEQETQEQIAKTKQQFAKKIEEIANELQNQVADKKSQLVNQLVNEVMVSDCTR